ncbi:uncharacterized protein LOC132712556 [Pantherophis guttatus]|uniref:Uncharacterized protein LOC132712556 n=1 Tax=Pantherophis guttatus TaxID=94885 RepID=A0ABM3ZPT2_PANGU|nr:uncharacterized protein LOC132712556 [Pantherophis guttatus]
MVFIRDCSSVVGPGDSSVSGLVHVGPDPEYKGAFVAPGSQTRWATCQALWGPSDSGDFASGALRCHQILAGRGQLPLTGAGSGGFSGAQATRNAPPDLPVPPPHGFKEQEKRGWVGRKVKKAFAPLLSYFKGLFPDSLPLCPCRRGTRISVWAEKSAVLAGHVVKGRAGAAGSPSRPKASPMWEIPPVFLRAKQSRGRKGGCLVFRPKISKQAQGHGRSAPRFHAFARI